MCLVLQSPRSSAYHHLRPKRAGILTFIASASPTPLLRRPSFTRIAHRTSVAYRSSQSSTLSPPTVCHLIESGRRRRRTRAQGKTGVGRQGSGRIAKFVPHEAEPKLQGSARAHRRAATPILCGTCRFRYERPLRRYIVLLGPGVGGRVSMAGTQALISQTADTNYWSMLTLDRGVQLRRDWQ